QRSRAGIPDRGRDCEHARHRCVVSIGRIGPLGKTMTNASAPARRLPLWLMGMTNAPFGMYGGLLVISIPRMLNERNVPADVVTAFTALTVSPGMWAIIGSPMLDVRFSRRWYSIVTVTAAALLLTVALMNLGDTRLAEILLVAGFFGANLYQS